MTPSDETAVVVTSASVLVRRTFLLGAGSLLGACSADAVDEPEPTIETRGAFIAVVVDGDYELLRTLAVLGSGGQDETLFVLPYAAKPRSFEEARELARDPALPVGQVKAIGKLYITLRDWRVVWFRSVSPEEEAGFR